MPPLCTHGGFFDRVSSASSQPESSSENGSQVPAATSKSTFKHKRRSITTSWIWNHGTRLESESESETKKRWRCNYCPLTLSAATTSNASTHLRNAHGRTEAGKLPTNQTTLEENESKATVNSIVLRKLIVEWIINRRHSFNEVEAESFRKIIEYIDKAAVSKLPHSHNTIRSDCLKYFNKAKGIICEHLSTARSKIHLSFDLSTSSSCKALLAITAHWTSNDYKAEATLLAIRELEEDHTGENIAVIIYDMAKEYHIVEKLGYFMMDNATNNDKALKSLNSQIQTDGGVGFDPIETRLRCFGHIMNLAVKDLLYGPKKKGKRRNGDIDEEEFVDNEEENIGEDESEIKKRTETEKKRWRALGAVGKAHNIVKWIRGKPQHRQGFLNQQVEKLKRKMVQADNATCWNSTWNMLDTFLDQRERIELYLNSVPELKDDKLTNSDWEDIETMMTLLKPFKMLTILGEERGTLYGSVSSILWGFDMLLDLLETERKKTRPEDAPFQRPWMHPGGNWINIIRRLINVRCILLPRCWIHA